MHRAALERERERERGGHELEQQRDRRVCLHNIELLHTPQREGGRKERETESLQDLYSCAPIVFECVCVSSSCTHLYVFSYTQ